MENVTHNKLDNIKSKIVSATQLTRLVAGWKVKSYTIVFTNGVFDLIHQGHIASIALAAQEGNKLVVGINSDASVKRLKGDDRPVNDAMSRALVLAAMQYVDAVCIFDEDTPLELIKAVKPDVIAKGGDYTPETVVGNDFVSSYGGKTIIIPLVDGFSTTDTINKLNNK
ncbi:MAG: D-glycero-beta-D-manno-heptose 1-phosphate adenylyltransferase [Taibaiella sp.]|nr:D-glycero-beta-D-manno-heptose 1-phosphate adenylyltransferase [Taibaiella sp.]